MRGADAWRPWQRWVALDPGTVAALTEHWDRYTARAATGGVSPTSEAFVFSLVSDGSVHLAPSSVSQRYSRLARRLGIDTHLHGLRHHSATELIAAGVDVRTVAGRLGHSGGGTTTLRVYAAWLTEADQRASAGLGPRMLVRPAHRGSRAERAMAEPATPREHLAVQLQGGNPPHAQRPAGLRADRRPVGDRELTSELRWLAGVLGDARDLEVLHVRLTRAVGELPDELVLGPVQARLTRFFVGREAAARTALVAALDSDLYRALPGAINDLLADPPSTPRARSRGHGELLALIDKAHRRVAEHITAANRLGTGDDRDTQWHEARKASKRLRHAAEAAAPVLGKPAHRLVGHVMHVQELLGDYQDAVVARQVLRESPRRRTGTGRTGSPTGCCTSSRPRPPTCLRPTSTPRGATYDGCPRTRRVAPT